MIRNIEDNMPIINVQTLVRFISFCEGTRQDFHSPAEQGITYIGSVGTVLDNEMGDEIRGTAVEEQWQEVVLFFRKEYEEDDDGIHACRYKFNLATILALARFGAEQLEKAHLSDGFRSKP